jgi:hypothetical protein
MNSIVQFVPRSKAGAQENLEQFIRVARDELTAFENGGAWQNNRWQQGRTVGIFSTMTKPSDSYAYTPMAEPFIQFAKAYVRFRYSHRPTVSVQPYLMALRCIEAALLDGCGCADVLRLNGAIMDVSATKCRAFYASPETLNDIGVRLQGVFDFCREKHLVPSLPMWRNPFVKPAVLAVVIGDAGTTHRERKLPTNDVMLKFAELFATSQDPETRYFSSILVLLMATPSRISEVLRLSVDCIRWEEDESGVRQMYVRWRAAKGKGVMKKWVIPVMHSVVEEAVRRLIETGKPARRAAKFAFTNPGVFMRHPGCITGPNHVEDQPLTPDELAGALNLRAGLRERMPDGTSTWTVTSVTYTKWIKKLINGDAVTYRRLAKHVLESYAGEDWPFIDSSKTAKVWDALCIHREYEHSAGSIRPFSWCLPDADSVNGRFGSRKNPSLFDRAGMTNPDGTEIKLTTHQLRHWLSTMCERAGMDDYTLAQWAGRADSTHNRHYDHRTTGEQLEIVRDLLVQGGTLTALQKFKNREAVTYAEIGIDRLGTAKATLYGMCTHDYAMTPCQKQRECMTCKEHVCIKGDHVTLDRIKTLESQTAELLDKALQAHEEGIFGADRWVDNHKWKLAHTRTMRVMLESTAIPDGVLLRIPAGHDPSPTQRTLSDLGLVDGRDAVEVRLPQVIPPLVERKDA